MKKTFILTLVLALGVLTTKADDFNLYYVANDGALAAQKWEVNKLQKITFEEGEMNVTATDGTTTVVSLADIQKLVFYTEEGATDIRDVQDENPEQTKEDVYDLMGRKLNIDRDQLPSGIYIIAGKKTLIK
jgi:hypothetical protein